MCFWRVGGLDGGDDLPRDAELRKRAEGGELVRPEVAYGLEQPDHPLLDDVLVVRADQEVGARLGADEVLILIEKDSCAASSPSRASSAISSSVISSYRSFLRPSGIRPSPLLPPMAALTRSRARAASPPGGGARSSGEAVLDGLDLVGLLRPVVARLRALGAAHDGAHLLGRDAHGAARKDHVLLRRVGGRHPDGLPGEPRAGSPSARPPCAR